MAARNRGPSTRITDRVYCGADEHVFSCRLRATVKQERFKPAVSLQWACVSWSFLWYHSIGMAPSSEVTKSRRVNMKAH